MHRNIISITKCSTSTKTNLKCQTQFFWCEATCPATNERINDPSPFHSCSPLLLFVLFNCVISWLQVSPAGSAVCRSKMCSSKLSIAFKITAHNTREHLLICEDDSVAGCRKALVIKWHRSYSEIKPMLMRHIHRLVNVSLEQNNKRAI